MKGQLIIPFGKKTKRTSFEGNPWYNLMGMRYLNDKYTDNCVVIPNKKIKPKEHTDISLRWIQTDGKNGYISVPTNFWSDFDRHLSHTHNKRFIIFPFGFTCTSAGGHATYLLYDVKNKCLERFDSIGKPNIPCLIADDVDVKIKKIFENKLGIKKYMKPFTDFKIFQELQDEEDESSPSDPEYGWCSVWSIFWADTRLSNPDIPRNELIKLVLTNLLNRPESLTEFIRNYSSIIVDFSKNIKSKSIRRRRKKSKLISKRRSKLISKRRSKLRL